MSRILLAFPYSSALYKYFDVQRNPSYGSRADGSSYYKTLYGNNPESHLNLALAFLLMYDEVWIAPADSAWPTSKISPDNSKFIAELGLHSDWEDFSRFNSHENREYLNFLVNHSSVTELLGKQFKIAKGNWHQIIQYALYDASLSATKRIPILCSEGRRHLISTLINIQAPSLHPLFSSTKQVQFVEVYTSLTGLALAPKNLDDLMDAKPDAAVRKYGNAFVKATNNASNLADVGALSVAKAALEAIETERVSNLFSGVLNWSAMFFKLLQQPVLAAGTAGASYLVTAGADETGWFEFKGSINSAIEKADLIRRLTQTVARGGGT